MDFYRTIAATSEGLYKEKMSKFISFAVPAASVEEAKEIIKLYQNEYHDARHVCWAYMIGTQRDQYLSSDNGEPSGTAGKPILGQINSFNLTNIVIVVVRYFGGIKLGTSGLIEAYRAAAADAITNGTILECHEQTQVRFSFDYLAMNDVMKVMKSSNLRILSQDFDNTCSMTVELDLDAAPALKTRLMGIDSLVVEE